MRSSGAVRLSDRLLEVLEKNGESHGRALSIRLRASSGAVARALLALEERNLVRSRWLGRTRLYRINADAPRRPDPLVGRAVRRLSRVKDPKPLAILPFGSRATGRARADSDLDIVVVVPDGTNTAVAWSRLRACLADFPVDVDLLVYSKRGASKWARLPANPLRDALDLQPTARNLVA